MKSKHACRTPIKIADSVYIIHDETWWMPSPPCVIRKEGISQDLNFFENVSVLARDGLYQIVPLSFDNKGKSR